MGGPVDLSVDIGGIRLKNPVMTASGTCGYGEELSPYIDLRCFGALVVKGLSLEPRPGNPPPRLVETPSGLINAIGLQNIGIEAFLEEKMPYLKGLGIPIIANIFGEEIEEYCLIAQRLEGSGVAGIELNISCPNVKKGGIEFGKVPEEAHNLVKNVRKVTDLPVITKLSPDVMGIRELAMAVEEAGSDAISLINTIPAMAIDVERRRPRLSNVVGGLSGPAIRPIAVRMVWEASKVVKVPIIGVGGIMGPEDALEFIIAGASAIQVGTANFIDPSSGARILKGIEDYLKRHAMSFSDLVGSLEIF